MDVVHYVNGKLVNEKETVINIFDLGLIRAYAVFDYVRLYNGKFFHLNDHLERLQNSAHKMKIILPISINDIHDIAHLLLEKNPQIDAGMRFIITGGLVQSDLISPSSISSLIILFHPLKSLPNYNDSNSIKVITTKLSRIFPDVKSTNYTSAILALKEAYIKNYDHALYINDKNEILEGTTSNIFFFKNKTLITADSSDILKGITRKVVLKLAEGNFPIEFRPLNISEIENCEEAFLTASNKQILSVSMIDDKIIGNGLAGENTKKLQFMFNKYLEKYFFDVKQNIKTTI